MKRFGSAVQAIQISRRIGAAARHVFRCGRRAAFERFEALFRADFAAFAASFFSCALRYRERLQNT
jgi:hypothetical protein